MGKEQTLKINKKTKIQYEIFLQKTVPNFVFVIKATPLIVTVLYLRKISQSYN